jgi:leader peptidase (prepilin peptidase)/N-methyltransferase
MEWVLLIWPLVLGSAFGSFLNVVVYRLPRGINLLRTSQCPGCNAKIASRDNVPILGWLWLRGRCRNCKEPISIRYPIVEFTTMAIFLLLAWRYGRDGSAELLALLEGRASWGQAGGLRVIGFTFDVLSGCFLLASCLIGWDGRTMPRTVWLGYLLLAVGVVSFLPLLGPLPLGNRVGLLPGVIGFGAGGLVAWAACASTLPQPDSQDHEWYFIGFAAIVGFLCGWQWVTGAGLLSAFCLSRQSRKGNRRTNESVPSTSTYRWGFVLLTASGLSWLWLTAPSIYS